MEEKKSTAEPSVSSLAEQHPGTSLNTGESLNSNEQVSNGTTPLLREGKSPSYGALPSVSMEAGKNDSGSHQDSLESREESMSTKNPLLQKPREASPEPNETNYDFTLDPIQSSGLWHKDKSGQHLMRFIVLILFLLFSSLVVSFKVKFFKLLMWCCIRVVTKHSKQVLNFAILHSALHCLQKIIVNSMNEDVKITRVYYTSTLVMKSLHLIRTHFAGYSDPDLEAKLSGYNWNIHSSQCT